MNTQPAINLNEVREVLEKLSIYIKNKMERNNPQQVATNDINLATQPIMESDHLSEEAPLNFVEATPTINQLPTDLNSQMNIQNSIPQTQPTSVVPDQAPAPQTTPNFGQFMSSPQETPEVVQPLESTPQVSQAQSTINNVDTLGLESIPNIDLSSNFEPTGIVTPQAPTDNEAYKAMGTSATIGYPQSSTPASIPVVMPNGTTEEMTNNDSVIVGPEAFNMTR